MGVANYVYIFMYTRDQYYHGSLGDLKKALEKNHLSAIVSTTFLIFSKFHLYFYNSIETRDSNYILHWF